MAHTMPSIPSASTKTAPGELPTQGQVSRRAFLRDPQNPLKSPESGLTGSEQSERQVPDGRENFFAKKPRRLAKSYGGRGGEDTGLLAALPFPTTWLT